MTYPAWLKTVLQILELIPQWTLCFQSTSCGSFTQLDVRPFTLGVLHVTKKMYVIYTGTPTLHHSPIFSASRSIHVNAISFGDHHSVPKPFSSTAYEHPPSHSSEVPSAAGAHRTAGSKSTGMNLHLPFLTESIPRGDTLSVICGKYVRQMQVLKFLLTF
jgi:hypothetical protein